LVQGHDAPAWPSQESQLQYSGMLCMRELWWHPNPGGCRHEPEIPSTCKWPEGGECQIVSHSEACWGAVVVKFHSPKKTDLPLHASWNGGL